MKRRLFSFGMVGVFNTLLNITLFNVLVIAGVDIGIANFISICVSIAIAFILSNHIVFSDRKGQDQTRSKFFKFIVVNIFTLFVVHQIVLLYFAYTFTLPGEMVYEFVTNWLDWDLSKVFIEANVSKAIAVLVSMAASYVLYDKFVFKNKKRIDAVDQDESQSN